MRHSFTSYFLLLFGFISMVQAQDSLLQAIAEPGDGVFSLLRRHVDDPYKYYGDFLNLNREQMRDSVFLYAGKSYVIPQGSPEDSLELTPDSKVATKIKAVSGLSYPIFGEAYASVDIKSNQLENTVYYVVSGHGGPDPGAMTNYAGVSIAEDEYAYDVSLRLARELISHGALVYVIIRDPNDGIRDDRILEIDHDEVNYPNQKIPLNQKQRLEQRVESVNSLYKKHKGLYQRLIVTHVDSRSKGRNIDVFFYHHHKSKSGLKLAQSIHKTFKKKYARYQPGRTYQGTFQDRSGLYLVKETLPAMTFIEIGNISNPKDQRRILDPDNRQALAKWICEGILLDYQTR